MNKKSPQPELTIAQSLVGMFNRRVLDWARDNPPFTRGLWLWQTVNSNHELLASFIAVLCTGGTITYVGIFYFNEI